MTPPVRILVGDVRATLADLPPDSIHCIVTSPPYWRLRSYLPAEHTLKPLEMGSEATPEEYVSNLVAVLRLARAALHPSGILWLNLGDSYNSSDKTDSSGLKPKDLVGIPWRVALALQADGWYWRSWLPWVKRSAMPSSVIDRPGSACEVWFMFTKSPRYFYDYFAVRQTPASSTTIRLAQEVASQRGSTRANGGAKTNGPMRAVGGIDGRNFRDADLLFESIKTPHGLISDEDGEPLALDVTNRGSKIPHFAMFPEKLVEPLIRACTSEKGCCPKCYAPWTRVVEKVRTATRPGEDTCIAGTTAEQHGNRDPQRHVTTYGTKGWEAGCVCDGIDRRIILTPTGERVGDDPSLATGRAGMNRPRGDDEGTVPMTRHEQAEYAEQLKRSSHRAAMATAAGSAFAHYIRTDESGARPIPRQMLETWIGCGWLRRVIVPESSPVPPVPCTVLDPFCGAGTTLVVAQRLGRAGVGCELNPEFAGFARDRLDGRPLPVVADKQAHLGRTAAGFNARWKSEVDGSGNGAPGEPATGRSLPCETPRAVPRLPLLWTTP